MFGERGFDFGSVPVPVDSRVRTVSARLGCSTESDRGERERWQQVLDSIRTRNPEVTMVHLDSLLWQIGTLSQSEMCTHLTTLMAPGLAQSICQLFDDRFSGHSSTVKCCS
jgi:DNA-(apurinic or apyrimidinic site) lyase